uniref:Transposase-like protein n=1 Tax=Dichotomius schiffleri TaxID=1534479 RepID=A0A7D6C6P1_9SCAR|nr:transposase-like protein [Dichotomius schiffleri]
MNSTNYETWLRKQLIPNLPANAVIVMDNAPYHNVQVNKAPNASARKENMIDWLTNKGISFSTSLLKPQLYDIVKRNKSAHITYKFDEILQQCGHVVLKLPPYHPDLNPIELIWATVKGRVAKRNTTFSLENVKQLVLEEFSNITEEEWRKRCDHVIKLEKNYLEREYIIEAEVEPLIMNIGVDSDSDDDLLSDGSSSSE